MRLVGHQTLMEEMRSAHSVFIIKPEEKRSLRRPRHRWENDVKMVLK
jgi:hypothetical protein